MGLRKRKIVIAITGASGSVYALKLIEKLSRLNNPPEEIGVVFLITEGRSGNQKQGRNL
jgi:3-polyprenyl-4-hydroxybenzoate decarboxylase